MYIVYHMCISIHKQITHTDVDLFKFCHVSCYANGKCHWLPLGPDPGLTRRIVKWVEQLIIPPRSGGIRKSPLVQLLLNGKSP